MKKIYSFSRLFTLLTLLFVGLGSAWADPITFTFVTSGSSSDGSTSKTAIADIFATNGDLVKSVSANKCMQGADGWGLKMGNSSTNGSLSLVLKTAVVLDSIVANASPYSSTENTLKINGTSFTLGDTKGEFAKAKLECDGLTEISTITLQGTKRVYVNELKLYVHVADDPSDTRTEVNITSFSATTTELTLGGTTTTTTTVANDQNGWTPAYTYNSSNTNVATVDANGLVTAVADGTADITVSLNIANDDANWKKGATYSKTVTITVVDPNAQNLSTTFDFVNENYGLTQGDDMSGAYVAENTVVSSDLVNIKFAASSAARYGTYSTKAELRIYKSKDVKFSVPAGCKITKITLSSRENKYHYPAQNGTEPIIWTGKAEEVTIQFVGSTQVIQSITVDYQTPQPVQVAVSEAGYATYAPATDMVVTEEDAVFYASNVTYDAITFTAIAVGEKVKAGEGLLVKGEGNHDFIPTTGATSLGETNKLHGVLTSTDLSEVANAYVLALDNGVAAFCPVSGGSLAAGKAYLVRPAAPAGAPQAMRIVFETEDTQTATGIENIKAEQAVKFIENGQLIIIKNGVRYNALGQVVR